MVGTDNERSRADSGRIVVIGVGNADRGDDAAGIEFARRFHRLAPAGVEVIELTGEPATVMVAWAGARAAFVVDAVNAGRDGKSGHGRFNAGRIIRIDGHKQPLPVPLFRSSTHVLGVAQAIELARALGQLPPVLVVYGIVGGRFAYGRPLSAAVEGACQAVVTTILQDIDGIRRVDC